MSDKTCWIITGRHEVLPATKRGQGEDGRWYVEELGLVIWFWEGQNLFDNEEDAKLRAIERVLGYALDHNIPIREEYVRTACAYANEFRERVKELEQRAQAAEQDAEKMAEAREAVAEAIHDVAGLIDSYQGAATGRMLKKYEWLGPLLDARFHPGYADRCREEAEEEAKEIAKMRRGR